MSTKTSNIEAVCRDAEIALQVKADAARERASDYVRHLRAMVREGWQLDAKDQALLDRADGVVR